MTLVNGVRVISNSEAQAHKWCRRHWWLAWHRGLTPRAVDVTSAAATGSRVHEALASWYVPTGAEREDPLFTLQAAQDRDLAVHSTRAFVAVSDEEAEHMLRTESELQSTFELERRMVEGYLEWVAETGVDAELEVLGAERYIEADFTSFLDIDQPTKIIGKIDARVRDLGTGRIAFIDHKTGNVPNSQLLQINQQLLHYILLEYLNGVDQTVSSKPLDSAVDVSRIQHTSSVAVSFLLKNDYDRDGTERLGSSSLRRQSREQQSEQLSTGSFGLSQFSSQQRSTSSQVRVTQESSERCGEKATSAFVDTRIERQDVSIDERSLAQAQRNIVTRTYWNTIRRVKRTATAKPPFYVRTTIDHNIHELRAYTLKLIGVIQDIVETERKLAAGVSHQVAAYPTPSRDCHWKCAFFKVCRMFDDGSRVEAALENLYEVRDPLSYYGGREKETSE